MKLFQDFSRVIRQCLQRLAFPPRGIFSSNLGILAFLFPKKPRFVRDSPISLELKCNNSYWKYYIYRNTLVIRSSQRLRQEIRLYLINMTFIHILGFFWKSWDFGLVILRFYKIIIGNTVIRTAIAFYILKSKRIILYA